MSNKGAKDTKENCITCHMPKVNGSATTIRESQTHAYHGFAGVYDNPKMLSKYVDLNITKTQNGFKVVINNKSPHSLRVLELQQFVKVIGTNNKPSMPWLATQTIKDSTIKANEKREITYNTKLEQGDEVVANLGYYIVNPKIAKKIGIKDKKLTNFITLKKIYYKN